jgi:hypothetical protein
VITLTNLGNSDIRPERTREHEFGADLSGFHNRANVGLTWFRRRTVDQLTYAGLPIGFGGARIANIGLTSQKGFELELNGTLVDTRALSWDVSIQDGTHTTWLLAIGKDNFADYTVTGGFVEGYPLGARFMNTIVHYADDNGDGILGKEEVQITDTAVYVGQSTPPRSQTLNTTIGLFGRRLRMSALLERRSGFTQINALKQLQCGQYHGSCREAVDSTAPFAQQAQALAMLIDPVQGSARFTYLEPGNFTRLREVTATADFPAAMTRRLRLNSGSISVSARNLALWTKFSGPDPESASVSSAIGGSAEGIPQGRTWVVRLDLGL